MKHAIWVVIVAGCAPSRSDLLTCEVNGDCDPGRFCDRGFCVTTAEDVDAGDIIGETDAAADDATVDAAACSLVRSHHFDACALPAPGPALTLSDPGTYTYDTNTRSLVTPGGDSIVPQNADVASGVVIVVDAFAINTGTTLRVTGGKPLIVASFSTIAMAGTLDVSSSRGATPGAGANATGCATAIAGTANAAGGGGGGGGGNTQAGGTGGTGAGGAAGGGGGAIARPLLAGGCAGGRGGNGDTANGGEPGAGGGAIQLTARDAITVDGTITVHGAGGSAARNDSGGGGGGSGGMIGLEAPALTVRGTLAANGGSGSGGASANTTSANGADGTNTTTVAAGGNPGGGGGRGGTGGGGASLAGGAGGPSGAGGGGGGGGAAGSIVLAGTSAPNLAATAVVTPAFVTVP